MQAALEHKYANQLINIAWKIPKHKMSASFISHQENRGQKHIFLDILPTSFALRC